MRQNSFWRYIKSNENPGDHHMLVYLPLEQKNDFIKCMFGKVKVK